MPFSGFSTNKGAALTSDAVSDLVDVVGKEVCQVAVLRLGPRVFDRIEFGRLGRQPLDGEPRTMLLWQSFRRGAMHRPAIAYRDDRTPQMTMHFPQEPNRVIRAGVVVEQSAVVSARPAETPMEARWRRRTGSGRGSA